MELEYTYWESKDGWFVGYLNIWPDHLTQGHDLAELEEMLADLYEFYKEVNMISIFNPKPEKLTKYHGIPKYPKIPQKVS